MNPGVTFVVALVLSALSGAVVKRVAERRDILDRPTEAPERKVHPRPVPLLGGIAIFLGFFLTIVFLSRWPEVVTGQNILPKYLWGMFLGSIVLMLGGYLDDRFRLPPWKQILFPIVASFVIIGSGIGIRSMTNPFGGSVAIDPISIPLFSWDGAVYHLTLWTDLFTFLWLMGMMYTTKFLDGLDGLVAGITTIGSIAVFILSMRPPVLQSDTAHLAIALAGAGCGFLLWNWHPAKLFLGEGGSLLTGFLLGTLAIVAGSKIATALLIMGIPILDVLWVIVRRVFLEHRSPFRTADRKHLHFRLLDVGFSHRGAVFFLYLLTLIFSATTIVFRGMQKLVALVVLAIVMLILGTVLVLAVRRRGTNVNGV